MIMLHGAEADVIYRILDEIKRNSDRVYPNDNIMRQSGLTLEEGLEVMVAQSTVLMDVMKATLAVGRVTPGVPLSDRVKDLRAELTQCAAMCVKQLMALEAWK